MTLSPQTKRICCEIVFFYSLLNVSPALCETSESDPSHRRGPNLRMVLSERLIAAGIRDAVSDESEIRTVILGTTFRGNMRSAAHVKMSTLSDPRRAVVELRFNGKSRTYTLGYSGPVVTRNSGALAWIARKRFMFDADGFKVWPSVSQANMVTRIDDLWTQCGVAFRRLVRRFGWRKAKQRQPSVTNIARQRLQNQITRKIDAVVASTLARGIEAFLKEFREPLRQHGQFPASVHFFSSPEGVGVSLVPATPAQPTPSTPPPQLRGSSDLDVSVHQSFINNLAEGLLAGRTFSLDDIRQQLVERNVPLPFWARLGDVPLSVTFRQSMPIEVKFDGSQVTVALRAVKFHDGQRDFPPVDVMFGYALERTSTGVAGTLLGPPSIEQPTLLGRAVGSSDTQNGKLRASLSVLLQLVLRQRFTTDEFPLPSRWASAGPLNLSEFVAEDGWFATMWRLHGNEDRALHPVAYHTKGGLPPSSATFRQWSGLSGQRSQAAQLIGVVGTRAYFRTVVGRTVNTSLNRLCLDDQALIGRLVQR